MKNKAFGAGALPVIFAVVSFSLISTTAFAVQPSVTLPSGMNLGSTSFYDGFGGKPGDSVWQVYLGYGHSKGIKDYKGNEVPIFNNPQLDVLSAINQYSYLFDTDTKYLGGHPGIDVIVPTVALDASFSSPPPFPGVKLKDNRGLKLGDPTVSLFVQYDPITIDGNPVFASRLSAGVTAPVGAYDNHKDLNPGNNFWSFSAYWAVTVFLSPQWSISLRPTYYYNFKNDSPASSLPLDPGVRDTQAGQSFSTNYNIGYRINDTLTVGINGYYLKQLTNDKINGHGIQHSKEQSFAIGPAAMLDFGGNKFYLSAQRESHVENRFKGDTAVTLRWLHIF